MKKNLLTLGVLALSLSANAQILSYVGNGAKIYVMTDALTYVGGGVKVAGDGVVDNSGNIMMVSSNGNADFTTNLTNGNNFILRLTNENSGSLRYGQLYIKGFKQPKITGVVKKEYIDDAHGTYQQIALPFYNKPLSSLSSELGKTFDDTRWSQNEILVWNNKVPRFDQLTTSQTTSNATWSFVGRHAPTTYYALGFKGISSLTKKDITGIPYADDISEKLENAGAGIDFIEGTRRNHYGEQYRMYLQDSFDASSGAWKNNYGRNLYQYGNPFLTNLDLGQLGKVLTGLQGVRVEPGAVATTTHGYYIGGKTESRGAIVVTYNNAGTPVGDTKRAIIRPMQTFVIKLNSATTRTLNFDDLRRFAYTVRAVGTDYSVNADRPGARANRASSTVKQIAVIAQDENANELGRTYYVVYNDAVTGQPTNPSTQATASKANIIGTFEEDKAGGLDEKLKDTYWLYINEANENEFKGKPVNLAVYSDKVKSLKFEIQENAQDIEEGKSRLTSGESFFINTGAGAIEVANGQVVKVSPSSQASYGLYYGKPEGTLSTDIAVAKPSSTIVVFDSNVDKYKLIFDTEWKSAKVQVLDMSGKIILSSDNVKTANDFVIELPQGIQGTFVVSAVSETGKKYTQKIVK